jgi:hypothetical protein
MFQGPESDTMYVHFFYRSVSAEDAARSDSVIATLRL